MTVLSTAWDCVVEGFFMFWETLWALVLGFTLSGMVQSFVSRAEMERVMGDHRPRTIVRTSLIGAASSSCSYAASALARSLFRRGADFTTAMVFMFASTNLVLELGIVLWLLMGWQFAAAELVGGVIMVALLVLLAPKVFPARLVEEARRHTGTDGQGGHGGHGEAPDDDRPLRERLRSRAGWADAAGYAVSDVTMLRRELLLGYLLAGILAVAVPASVYGAIFLSGHGLLTDVENVVVGPFIAFISFVCSVGNVPLAAALYEGGISFGGTVAFVFADLIALPLVLIYAKFYGRRVAVRLFLTFWLVMGLAGLAVDLLFRAVGIPAPARRAQIAPTGFTWNYTTVLNIVFLAVAVVVYLTYRNRERLGGGRGYAKDPVCGMQVEQANPGATTEHEGRTVFFCSDRCRDRFLADPDRYLGAPDTSTGTSGSTAGSTEGPAVTDPVCGMEVDPEHPGATAEHDGRTVSFCSPGCRDQFLADPARYLTAAEGTEGTTRTGDVDLRGERQHQGQQHGRRLGDHG